MLELRLFSAMELKHMMTSISSISNNAFIQFSENSILFHVTHKGTNILAILHLSSRFFLIYQIPRIFLIHLNLSKINSFLRCNADDNGGVYICSSDEFPITHLDFYVHNSKEDKAKKLTVDVTELEPKAPWTYEPVHEFKIPIIPHCFQKIARHSARNRTPIHIIVTCKNWILTSGSEQECQMIDHKDIQDSAKYKVKDAPQSMLYKLQLPWYGLARSFFWASGIADGVCVRDSYCDHTSSGAPPMLEFNFGPNSRLLFYIRGSAVQH